MLRDRRWWLALVVERLHSHLYLQAVKLEIWQRRVWVYSFISPRLLDSVFVSLNQKQ
jgi:cytochrome c oxidase subunit IV